MEASHGIEILWLSVQGSRAWCLDHPMSDHDMRGVFRYTSLSSYVTLHPGQFQHTIVEFTTTPGGSVIDWNLWDISRVLKALAVRALGNAEWLFSPRVFDMNPVWTCKWKQLLDRTMGVDELAFRFASLAQSLSKSSLTSNTEKPEKMCLITLRPMLLSIWLRRQRLRDLSLYNDNDDRLKSQISFDLVTFAHDVLSDDNDADARMRQVIRICANRLRGVCPDDDNPPDFSAVTKDVRMWIKHTCAINAWTPPDFVPSAPAAWDTVMFAWATL